MGNCLVTPAGRDAILAPTFRRRLMLYAVCHICRGIAVLALVFFGSATLLAQEVSMGTRRGSSTTTLLLSVSTVIPAHAGMTEIGRFSDSPPETRGCAAQRQRSRSGTGVV